MKDETERLALAHALRTPLTSALLAAGALADEHLGALNLDQRDAVRTLVEDLERLRILVERGLDIERAGAYAGPLERARLDVGQLVARAALPLRSQGIARGVDLVVDEAPAVSTVVDPVKLTWSLAALIGNAVRYARTRVEVRASADAQRIAIEIADDGPGIEPGPLERLFERHGAGLGLYLVREVVEAHGGSVEVSSVPGEGSRFVVYLTRAVAQEER